MKVNADLHCHTGASGGVGNLSFEKVAETMPLKGIDLLKYKYLCDLCRIFFKSSKLHKKD